MMNLGASIRFSQRRAVRIRCLASAAVLLVSAGAAQQALAQAAPAGQASPEDEIVVSAQRHNESLSKVPLSIVTYSQELMDQ